MTADQPDAVDRIAEQWARERPELDVGPMLVVGRIHRVAELLDQGLRPVFAQADLGNGDFDVLASLRRAGAPYKLTPTELAGTTMVTSGAVTKRVDRLVQQGLVERTRQLDGRPRPGRRAHARRASRSRSTCTRSTSPTRTGCSAPSTPTSAVSSATC